ncbi:IQ domain-containing protein D, partial [Corvus brachyrhynchos]
IPLSVMKVLDPCQLKPDSTETERILTVFDEAIVKLEITRLIPRIIGSLERFARMLGPEITSSLLELQKLSVEIQDLLTSPGDEERRRAVEQRLKCSLRNTLRLFLANPLLYHGLKYEVWVRQSPADVFIKAFKEFRDFTLERLLTSPDEEKEKIQFMEDISLRIEKNTETISALQAELEAAIQTRDEESLGAQPSRELQGCSRESVLAAPQVAVPVGLGVVLLFSPPAPCCKPNKALWECRRRILKPGQTTNVSAEGSLSWEEKKCKTERETEKWVQKYDTDMAEKQATYEEVEAVYNEEKAQLALLMEKHALLLQEYTEIEEERRMLKEKAEEAAREAARRNDAATYIQAFWKGYLVRSIYKSKLKKGKGKGK